MLLREERARCRRPWATALATVIGCLALVPSAGASAIRHYEKVSPADKGQGDIVGDGLTTIAARDGDAVAFNSRTPFGDTIGSGVSGQTQFVARRDANGAWTTHAVTPTPQPSAVQTFFAATSLQYYSEDLRTAVVWAYDLPASTDDTPNRNNIYLEDVATRALTPLTIYDPASSFPTVFGTNTLWGVSSDAEHVAFVTDNQMLPEAAPGVPNAYQSDHGVLSLAGVLPDGSVPAGGSDIVPANYRGAMSADGSRLAFTASPSGGPLQLYLRIDGRRTVWISQPEGSDQSDPVNVSLQGMTPDGGSVFFVTDSRLLDADTNSGPDIYRYTDSANPASDENLTLITQSGDVPNDPIAGAPLVGMSDDGERVYYYTSRSVLAVWDHGTTTVISRGVPHDGIPARLLSVGAAPGYARTSPDGIYLAFITNAPSRAPHALTGELTNGHYEMYLYRLSDHRLNCVSCVAGAVTSDVTVSPAVTSGSVVIEDLAIRPSFLSDSGQIFFSTADSLVPQDKNGVLDAYEYDAADGSLSLLSTGTGSNPTSFADAGANGDDVFLVTRQKLVKSDDDNLVDMYDARVGPALPEPPTTTTPPCDGESCQAPPSATPPDDVLGSLTFDQSDASTAKTFTVGRRFRVHGAAGSVPVRFLAAGTLRWSGKGLRAGSTRHGRAGTYRIRLLLSKHARAQIAKRGRFDTTIRLTFLGADGAEVTRTARVTFRAAAKKGR